MKASAGRLAAISAFPIASAWWDQSDLFQGERHSPGVVGRTGHDNVPRRFISTAEKGVTRQAGRKRLARANGMPAAEMEARVHHSRPLEYAHLLPKADPNSLANLWALRGAAHKIASAEWTARLRAHQPVQGTDDELSVGASGYLDMLSDKPGRQVRSHIEPKDGRA